MGDPDDIHSYDARFDSAMNRLDRVQISERCRGLIKDFIKDCRKQGVKKGSLTTYLGILTRMAVFFYEKGEENRKDLDRIKEDNFDVLLEYLDRNGLDDYNYRKLTKKFFRWKTDDELPKWVRNIKLIHKDTPVQPSDLLTQKELDLLLRTYTHPRGRAFAAVTLDSCQRVGAIGTLRIKSVEQNTYGALIYLSRTSRNLKTTQPKPIPLTWSAGYLNQWLSIHPLRDDPEAPLWVNLHGRTRFEAMSYDALRAELLRTAEEAGLKRKIHFHLFKHQKVTDMIKQGFSDQQIKFQAGWAPDSTRMMKIYGNFLDKDMVNSIYEKHGLEVEKKTVTLKQCPRCHVILVPEARICHQCALVLESSLIDEVARRSMEIGSAIAQHAQEPEIAALLMKLLKANRK